MKTLLGRLELSYVFAFLSEATLGLMFILYISIARVLGPQQYGVFSAAVALGGILSFFIQFGFPTLITREVAANSGEGSKLLGQFILLESLNSLPVILLILPISRMLGFEGNGIVVCYLVIFAEICRSIKMTLRGVLKGKAWFSSEAAAVGLERFFSALIVGIVLFLTEDLVWVVSTLVLVRIVDITGLTFYLSRQLNIWSFPSFSNLLTSYKVAFPFAISTVFWILHYQVDVVMLQGISTPEEAGYYSAAYRLMEIFATLPRVIFSVAFTKFAQCYATNPEQLPREIYKATGMLLKFVLPVVVMAGLLQTTLVHIVYGEAFTASISSLSILIPNVTVVMLGAVASQILLATGEEKRLPPILFVTLIVNVISNAILIPILGASGAATSTLISESIMTILSLGFIIRIGYKKVGQIIRLIVIISLLLAATPSLIINGLNPIVGTIIMGTCVATIYYLMKQNQSLKNIKKT